MSEYVKLRGLPFESNAVSIVEFLDNQIEETMIHFVADRPGGTKPHSGEAFIEVPLRLGARKLLRYNKRHMGSRYIEVIETNVSELKKFASRLISADGCPDFGEETKPQCFLQPIMLSTGVAVTADTLIKGRGLPFEASLDDVAERFSKYGVDPIRVVLDRHQTGPRVGQATGNCFILFEDKESRDAALVELNRTMIGNRYLELFEGNDQDVSLLERIDDQESAAFQESDPPFCESDPDVLRLRGLPFRASKRDVVAFFEPSYIIGNEVVHLVKSHDGRVTGEALVKMGSVEEAEDAQGQLHKKNMDERYIEVFLGGDDMRAPQRQRDRVRDVRRLTGNLTRESDPGMRPSPYDRTTPPARAGASLMHRGGGDDSMHGGPGAAYGGRRETSHHSVTASGGRAFWLRLRGLPFEASPVDVLEFFSFSFELQERDVIIEKMNGRATGQAFVKFSSSEDASEATGSFHKTTMGTRYIEVYESNTQEVSRRMGVAGH